jgi:hypothetical protein
VQNTCIATLGDVQPGGESEGTPRAVLRDAHTLE